jgi:hypothetical protein
MKSFLYTLLILLNCFCPGNAQNKYESAIPERTYLHTDRNVYMAGNYLFYTLYLQGNRGQMSKYAYLSLRDCHNLPIIQVRVEISNQTAFGSIYLPDTLHSDIYQIVCYTNSMRNEAEESYFNKEIVIASRFDKQFNLSDTIFHPVSSAASISQNTGNINRNDNLVIHLDKQVFDAREKVIFLIETKDIPENLVSRVSVSINEIIPGITDEPSISEYFGKIDKAAKTAEKKQNRCDFQPEINSSVIQGRILPVKGPGNQSALTIQDNVKDSVIYTVLLSTPDSIANMQYTKTDSSGSFSFMLNPYYEGKELIIRLKENAGAVITLDDKFKLVQPFIPSGIFNVSGIKPYLNQCVNIAEARRYYPEKNIINTQKDFLPASVIPRIYYKTYSTVFPGDFIELHDFVEISREILPALKVRKHDNNYFLSFIDTRNKDVLNIVPMIFLDGVPVNEANQIIDLGSGQIRRIDLLPVIRYYGEMPITGIVAIFSRNLEIDNIQFETPTIRYRSLSSQSYTKPDFYKPADPDSRIPDLRQVLLWDPEIILHSDEKHRIEFYTSDLQGEYRINIQGIVSNGLPVNGSAIFSVKYKKD